MRMTEMTAVELSAAIRAGQVNGGWRQLEEDACRHRSKEMRSTTVM